jgi:DNA-binding transcriptional LysR family regulator
MLKLDSVAAFIAIADTGSISEAARRLGVSKSVASERLSELERALGATLIHRTTRKLAITEDGTAFYQRARRILREVSEAAAEVGRRRGELVGPLRVAAPVSFGALHLGPALYRFLAENPKIELSLDLDDRFVNLLADGYDAVVRHGPIADEHVIVKRLATSRRFLVAAPAYLQRFGRPGSVGDLKDHRGIVYTNRGAADWRFRASRRYLTVRPGAVALRVNNGLLMRDAAIAGLGLALLPSYFIQPELAKKRLAVVDVGAEAEGAVIYLAYPYDRRDSAKLNALAAWLRDAFGTPPYWDAPPVPAEVTTRAPRASASR